MEEREREVALLPSWTKWTLRGSRGCTLLQGKSQVFLLFYLVHLIKTGKKKIQLIQLLQHFELVC